MSTTETPEIPESQRVALVELPWIYEIGLDEFRAPTREDFELGQLAQRAFGLIKMGQSAVFEIARQAATNKLEFSVAAKAIRDVEQVASSLQFEAFARMPLKP